VGPCYELEAALIARFGLRRAIVVPSPLPGADVRPFVGAAAGQYLSTRLPQGGALGTSWGGTINAAARNLAPRKGMNNRVVLLCGGLAESTAINPHDNAAMMARALDARCYYITARRCMHHHVNYAMRSWQVNPFARSSQWFRRLIWVC
jgi:DNA-binding transcriptional regulator LsrR (DeoR family)